MHWWAQDVLALLPAWTASHFSCICCLAIVAAFTCPFAVCLAAVCTVCAVQLEGGLQSQGPEAWTLRTT
jgi:hypothetical protein